MANETSKQMFRRSSDRRYFTRWLVGDGIDVGCGPDPLSNLSDFFPLMRSVRGWDLPDGDAMLMETVADGSFDFVHSSHCLEHLVDPVTALRNWIRICKPGGHLVITIPDEDLYEQGVWPSTFNEDHKWTFTILKKESWSPRSINLVELLAMFADDVEILKLEKLDSTFDYNRPRYDQTLYGLAESAIEFVLYKRPRSSTVAAPALDTNAHFARALELHEAGRLEEALENYKAVLASEPGHVPALNNLSLLFPGEIRESLLRRALEFKADDPDALLNLAAHLGSTHRLAEARDAYLNALAVSPNDRRVIAGLCETYEGLGELDSAIALLESRLAHFDDPAGTYCQLGKYCESANRTDDALRYLERAISINPEHAEAHILAGRQHLKKGRYDRGATELSWIWHGRAPEFCQQVGLFADEDGRLIRQDGRTIVLSADSGLGDTLQFVRYAQLLRALGASVVLECQNELVRLLHNAEGVDKVVPLGQLTDTGDVRVPLHNLIGAFRSTPDNLPNAVPYLHADAEEADAWRKRVEPLPGLRVGLCWAGSPQHWRNRSRSIPVEQILPLLDLPGISFVSLQKDGALAAPGLHDWSADFTDMAATAALIQNLDLVISVDSAVAHLAGALGRPVWLLNRFDSCWRWMEERPDSPWYPTLTQFRQQSPEDWATVLAVVATTLVTLVNQREAAAVG
ncbi:tetratricopeptide repeat protein [Paraburkholderia caballeronis]|uniref:Tetratricopeptide repeat-containing protein n=1 Tax=Paraburkholderia caballeronis TaxID=416943 RepID=A0A1H7SPV2_9BURK|nr:tetratricopeptide repeat protein [Paraburkholderia caballeronis]PXW22422.1 tetratricopeptide repeat protein [Paraburkholderia caballeronis]PXW96080.1 tetratricopeptide repeat protein [Paraburkholderia caballeronis]RAJ92446.1 tetratricopeptide repeat protein [Paraburkholderia caballeronis]SEB48941.1 Tetratricopeptide repeat-containing protein [Paraburkholderia caballeronis]SEL74543.1 Tetratricopeptide repeat-containing protein [Paraburkholderia caballeronis]